MYNKLAKQQGFTLIELLLALGIMAIFSLLAYRGLDSVLRLHENSYKRQQYTQAIDRALTQLSIDLRQANYATIIATKKEQPNIKRVLRINRKIDHKQMVVEWFIDQKQLFRTISIPSANKSGKLIQTAVMLNEVSQFYWSTIQVVSSDSGSNSSAQKIWQDPFSDIALDAELSADTEIFKVLTHNIAINLTVSGKNINKYFLIGH